MLSIPRLHQQQLQLQQQLQHNSSNSQHHQQYPYSQNCHTEYNSAAYSDLPRSTYEDEITALSQQLPTDLMQPETWGALSQQTHRLPRGGTHQRESSLSSLGSSTAGPASPFNHNTSNPHIAITDTNDQGNPSYYHLAKSMAPYAGYQTCGGLEQNAMPEMAYPITLSGPSSKPRLDRTLMQAPDFSGGSSRSHPASVASSIAGDSPATPTVGEADNSERRRKGNVLYDDFISMDTSSHSYYPGFANAPKLDRTMTDIYADELYSPNFAITSTPPSQTQVSLSPTNDVFSQRLNAANNQHLSAAQSPVSSNSRDRSPFRTGSPLAPSPAHEFGNHGLPQNLTFNSAQRIREQNKAHQDAQVMRQQMNMKQEPETPKTISPKDAILEFNESEGDNNFPLFPQSSSGFDLDQFPKSMVSSQESIHDTHSQNHFNFLSSHAANGISVPQQYPFIAHPRINHETPPRLSSAGSSSNESRNVTPVARPGSTAADGGTYTCTYHGCTLRFETPALLQKHKREGHRQTQNLGPSQPRNMGMTSALLNTQAGPHRCDRINPSTGKPCNTVFSRPYDLTRHEDTIHNARKQKVRCDLCTEEKTFSRADALTRHYRVCHPDVELPGKHRRRAGA
ncbi:26S proteasome subunit RPN4 [Fusarium pseudocircinatum]|uniref:26S proteasome subunit RPN4 n=1 Tax=Fusarium pseudocircinatum TaxID=56676 RepID=A0A8H5PIT7_9HYPO|nr:26S proteasome subunit RPN4 [Fusarium pseudocircinatum]